MGGIFSSTNLAQSQQQQQQQHLSLNFPPLQQKLKRLFVGQTFG